MKLCTTTFRWFHSWAKGPRRSAGGELAEICRPAAPKSWQEANTGLSGQAGRAGNNGPDRLAGPAGQPGWLRWPGWLNDWCFRRRLTFNGSMQVPPAFWATGGLEAPLSIHPSIPQSLSPWGVVTLPYPFPVDPAGTDLTGSWPPLRAPETF